MNLKIGFMLLMYWTIISLVFLVPGSPVASEGYTSSVFLNETDMVVDELDTGGLFATGVSFGRFVGWVFFGLGIAEDTPFFFKLLWSMFQTIITILTIMFIIDSIWSG